ncbi:MAG: hypothetical protein K1X88_01470 [Nannocystaceae bacterium]|nr:hypothetical protein [Nannocystaceae bacterium]
MAALVALSSGCGDAAQDETAGESSSGPACVAAPDGSACACGTFEAPQDWSEAPSCSASERVCCDDGLACTCATPRCYELEGGHCKCAAFVVPPEGAMMEVASCDGLICCDRGTDCECASAVLTCTADGQVDQCTPPQPGADACGANLDAVTACPAA